VEFFGLVTRRLCYLKPLLLIGVILLAAFLRLYRIDSLPPSAGYDQATYGLDALSILDGERPVFLSTNFGREPLFSYLVAISFLFIGDRTTAIYVVSAVVGVLTVPVVYLVADEMFSSEKGYLARWGGLLAALVTAVSHWHLSWSRLGMRAILVPLFTALVVYFLWRGLRVGSRWAFVASGFFLGLSLYTYQAARIIPVLVLFCFARGLWTRRSLSRRDLLGLALVAGVALLVFVPLGYYFWSHPGSAGQRVEQTLVIDTAQDLPVQARALFAQVVRVILTFVIDGDRDPRVTIPGRPALNPFLALPFLLGLGVGFWRLKKPLYATLLAWLVLMSLPAMLARYGAVTKRALGAFPAVAMLIVVGVLVPCHALGRAMARRPSSGSRALSRLPLLVVGMGFIFTTGVTCRDYFLDWGKNENLFIHFEAGVSAVGEYVGGLPAEERVYVSPLPSDHPSILLSSDRREGIRGYNGHACIVLPTHAEHGVTYVVVPGEDAHSLSLLRRYFPGGVVVGEGPLYYNQPYFLAYRVPPGVAARVEPARQLSVNWSDEVELLGYALDASGYEAGEVINLTLYYWALDEMEVDYTVFAQLWGPPDPTTGSPVWGQDDTEPCRRGYPTSSWDRGEIVADTLEIPISDQAPSGRYSVVMGFYHWPSLERLPVKAAIGQKATDDAVVLTPVQVTSRD
jgi:4-amino-4-deoxy-L-arabinose transferase-like glycosyltransferase